MSADRELDALLAPLRDGPVALSSAAEADVRRQRLLPAVRAEVERTPARRRRARIVRRTAAAASALAAAGLCVLAVAALRGPAAVDPEHAALRIEPLGDRGLTFIDASGMPSAIGERAAITAPGEIVASPSSWSRLSTARGVHVDLAPHTRLRVTAVEPRARRSGLRLEQGEVRCRVPRLGPSEQFAIATPDANVIVHGTVFTVQVGAPDPSGARATCVRVDEGLVEVQHRAGIVRLGPGAHWGCAPHAVAPDLAAAVTPVPQTKRHENAVRRPARRAGEPRRAFAPRRPDGTLDEENRLLAAALDAERDSDRARARALFATLLERHPSSPLAPEARAGLLRAR